MDPRTWQRFRRNRGAVVGAVIVVFVVVLGVVGPWVAPHDPNEQYRAEMIRDDGTPRGMFEREGFPLGADSLGRDELSRLLHGGRVSLLVAVVATAVALIIGVSVGLAAGYFGGPVDTVAMRTVDVLLSLPFLLVAIVIQKMIRHPSLWTIIALLGGLSWTSLARVTRAKTMQVRELDFVRAARALGAGHGHILLRHVLPNVIGPIVAIGTMMVAGMILSESALSYLGLGVPPPAASWGSMLSDSDAYLFLQPRLFVIPAVLIVLTVAGFNFFGEGLRDALDPKD